MRRASGDDLLVSLVDGLDSALVVVDADLVVTHWNAAMERLTGLSRERACGRSVKGLAPTLEAISLPHQLERSLAVEIRCGGELPGGAWVEARCMPLLNAEGVVEGAAAVLADVTELRRRSAFLRAMQAIGRSLTASLDIEEVLDTIVSRAMEVMSADSSMVVAWDGGGTEFHVMRSVGRLSERYVSAGALPVGGGPTSRALLDGKATATRNILTDPELWLAAERRAEIEREGFKAVAAAPLTSKGRVHGALVVHYWSERLVGDDELHALTLLGEQAALAIDNARLYADATRRAERLRELADVERLVGASLDLDDVLRRIAEATARLVGAPVVHLWTADPGAQLLRLRARSVEPGVPDVPMPMTFAFGEGVSGVAAATRQPVFVPDVSRDLRARNAAWRQAGFVSVLAAPIVAGEALLGVLTVRARPGALSAEEDRAMVTSLAARAALAIQNARAYEEAVRRGARLRDLAAVSQSITASLDTGDVMKRIAEAAAGMTSGAMAAVHVLDAGKGVLRFAADSSSDPSRLPQERPADSGMPGLVVTSRQPVLVADRTSHPGTLVAEWWQERPSASYYGVPITCGETLVGVLEYIVPEGVPSAEDQEVLRLMAAYAGIAIRNASLYQAERAQAGRVGALASINQRISSALELDALLRMVAESAAYLTGVQLAVFWLADEERRTLTVRSASAPGVADDLAQAVVGYDFGGIGWVARNRTALVVDDVFADARFEHHEWWRRWSISAFAAYPVLAGDELLAVLVLASDEPICFPPEMRDIADLFIAQAGVAIQNARLFLEARRRRDVAEALARLGRELAATLDIERIAELVTDGIVELLGGSGSAAYRYEPTESTLNVIAASGDVAVTPGLVLKPGEGAAGRAVAERRIVTTGNVLNAPDIPLSPELRRRIEAHGYRAVVAVPLVAGDRVVGALAMGAEAGRSFTADDLQLLQTFADQAAMAVENARLYASARDSLARLRETQAQLVHAGKMSALGQLVSGVAHELNNPLSVIIGYGQLMLSRNVPEPLKRPVELMVQQGDRMAKIVRNLLYFARQRPPERAPVDLNHVVEQTLALRLNQLTLSGIVVERDVDPELPPVLGDSQQLQQVMLNLLLNAEQAITGEDRSGRIVFRTRASADRSRVRAEVVDDGPGIPPEVLPRVFEPFFTTKDVGAGTGLGLSVSYGIVEEHGGRLGVESQPGKTTFTLELPAAAAVASEQSSPTPARTPAFGFGRVALVVEDEPGVLDLVVALLREAGFRVDVAPGGRLGLERVSERHYDVVVSDMRMADGSGEEFYRRALGQDRALTGRFVFVTGDTANAQAWSFLREANVPFIEKPFTPDAFLHVVRRVVTALTSSGFHA